MKETLKTTNRAEDGNLSHKEVEGERITIAGHPCFIHFEKSGTTKFYTVTDLETGAKVCMKLTKNAATKTAEQNFKKNPAAILQMKNFLINKGVKMPVNI